MLKRIGSPVPHQPNYSRKTTYSLKMLAEDKGKVFISNSAYKLKWTVMADPGSSGYVQSFSARTLENDGLTEFVSNYDMSTSKYDET